MPLTVPAPFDTKALPINGVVVVPSVYPASGVTYILTGFLSKKA